MGKKKIILSKKQLIDAGKLYAEPYISMNYVAMRYRVCEAVMSRNLFFGIAEGIFSEELSKAVADKVIYAYSQQIETRRRKWEKAFELRNIHFKLDAYKKDIPYLVDEVERLQSLLSWPDEDEKETLELKLEAVQQKLSDAMHNIKNLIAERKEVISTLHFDY